MVMACLLPSCNPFLIIKLFPIISLYHQTTTTNNFNIKNIYTPHIVQIFFFFFYYTLSSYIYILFLSSFYYLIPFSFYFLHFIHTYTHTTPTITNNDKPTFQTKKVSFSPPLSFPSSLIIKKEINFFLFLIKKIFFCSLFETCNVIHNRYLLIMFYHGTLCIVPGSGLIYGFKMEKLIY